ncbi:Integrin alpha-PS2-like Protein [Tribolium castaneum]|uniref:Integrin alpha-PS2-like Protein n=1 Tax=Tribolium castaneum TaxID=7070 RepID=D6X1K8_TRICA|nr:PREDICTED: integrin alpha-PS2 isoform X1 [Tribolium castaneum]EFA09341.2 Integrin alpha-PS2-like Protein [Tribolium castaneum]|eukprot:XP_008198597.1 PREDICTED: integrin alpha-PS2 isoform X1 [Tribolium castaneum]
MCPCELCVLCFFVLCVYTVTAFNVDSFNYATYQVPSYDGHDSMFGFSIALHRERNTGWLIVGAPEASSSQPGVIHGGAVYKCPTDRDGGCEEIPFDTKGNNRDASNNLMDNKTEQWFGATVSSSGRAEGPIVACAPRYTWFPRGRSRRDPVGTCYVCNGFFEKFNEYSPCRTYQWGYHRQGSCQAGFSAAINSVGDRLFIGSPGSWYWQGQMYSVDAHATFEFKPTLFSATYGDEGQVHQQSLETRPAVFATTEGTEKDDDSYMGYSTIVGDFLGTGEEGIAVGMPRGNNLKGKVLLFTMNLTNYVQHFTSDQIGSYYGYALAACDVDGDGKLDLIVGAPMYTVQNNKGKYDVGRVYVIYHESDRGRFVANYVIDGFNSKSRFGQAVASLGDINQDGFGDFAVGAPYDGAGNRGAVYIYHGSSKGVRKKFSQVIFAEDVAPSLTTFGFSITGGMDLDNNQYPDMAVGAYESNKAFFFRARPVISVEASVKFLTHNKFIDITRPDYTLRSDGTTATKTQIQFCSRYYGKGIPNSLNLGVEYILDSKKLINSRMGFVDDEGQSRKNATITMLKGQDMKCTNPIDVYVKSEIRDKLTALVVEARYWMQSDQDLTPSNLQQLPRNPRSFLTPVLDLNSPPSKKDSISIQKNCGSDNICIPDLVISVTPSVQEYYLDSGENFYLNISVTNNGEDAFESTVEVKYPDGFFYISSQDIQVVSHVLCSASENFTIKCDIGNPVPSNKVVNFKLLWQPNYAKELPSSLFFEVLVNSTNEDLPETRYNNKQKIGISILYDVIQEIRGWSIPNEVLFTPSSSLYAADISNQTHRTSPENRLSEDVIGPQVIHVYELKNGGRTTIKATEIFFVWPATTASGEDFLYLVDPPHFSFTENLNLKCGPIPANYRDFEVPTRRKSIWELYDIDVSTDTTSEKYMAGKNQTYHKIGSTIGGKIVTSDDKINKEVEKSGDSSKVFDVRHNKTTWHSSSRVQIFEETKRLTGNFRRFRLGGKQYAYRCLQSDQEVDCGTDFTFSRLDLSKLLQTSSAGPNRYSCLDQDSFGNWRKTDCGHVPTIPVIPTVTEGETRVQIFGANDQLVNQLESRSYKKQTIDGKDFIYRCFRRANGREEEIDCGQNFSFSSIDLPWILEQSGIQQQEGNVRYACLKPDSDGNLRSTTCDNVPKIRFKTQIIRKFWGSNDTHYWNETGVYDLRGSSTIRVQVFQGDDDLRRQLQSFYHLQHLRGYNFIYRCLDGNEEVDCDDFSLAQFTDFTDFGVLLTTGVQGDGKIRYICLQSDNYHNLRSVPCGHLPPIHFKTQVIQTSWKSNGTHYWNNTGVYRVSKKYDFSTVQVFQGGSEMAEQLGGTYRFEKVDGQVFIYRCFKNTFEVDCGQFNLLSLDLLQLMRTVAIQREGNLRYFCLEMDSFGNWRGADCGHLPRIHVTEPKRVITQEHILKRCLKLVNGNWQELDCRAGFHSNDGTFIEECYQTINGRRDRINCTQVPPGSTFDYVQTNTRYNQESASTSHGTDYFSGHGRQTYRPSYGTDYNYNQGQAFGNQSYSYENSYETELYEDEDDKAISGYMNPHDVAPTERQFGRRDPKTYGTYGEARSAGVAAGGLGEAAQGRGFTAVALDLGNLGSGDSHSSHWSETHHVAPVHNTIGRDNVPTDAPSPRNWHHGRKKRQIIGDSHPSIAGIKEEFPCKNLGCVYMRCTIENLQHGKPLTIALRGRLNAKVLRDMKLDNALQFSSMMLARVHKVPHLVSLKGSKPVVKEVETAVKTPEEIKSETVPLWVVVLSAVAGTIILLLIIFLLYKLGFFKRNRPSSAPERQPLNRNGYHHGDEAL